MEKACHRNEVVIPARTRLEEFAALIAQEASQPQNFGDLVTPIL